MQSQNQDPTFVLDEKTRQEREEKGQILKHEDELQDISNMNLSKFNQDKTTQLMNKSRELRDKAEEQISDVKSRISERSGNLREGAGQKENEFAPKGQELKQKAQEYFNKASEKASEIKKDIKEETSSKYESKSTVEKAQVHHGERPLTEKTKHDILELTEKLTEKIQALKQVDQKSQSGIAPSSQAQTQDFEQNYSASQQEKLESQPSTKSQETKFEQTREEQPQSSPLEQKQPEIREQEQEEKQVQKPEEKHTERTPLVDQVLGRVHSASDNLHHKVGDFKSAFKVEAPKDTERVPLIDKLTHGIHNVADRITGVFKHKAKPTRQEKDQSPKYHPSKSLPGKQPLGEDSSSFQEEDLTENQEGIEEGGFGSYLIGEEFRENFEGFSKTVENALQEDGSKSFGGKEYSLDRFEQEQKGGLSADDFRIQGANELRKEWPSERSELKDSKSEQKVLFNEGRGGESGLQGSKDISSSTEGTSSPSASRGINILKQLEEDIKLIDRLLEKSIERGAKYEPKEVDTSSSPSFKTSQGFGSLSNQSAEIGINTKDNSSLTRQVYEDVNANNKLLEGAILGESSRPTESSESSATKLYGQSSKPRTEMFRDITNEVAGSISQQAEKDLSTNDKLLNKSIREGKAGFRAEPEDKENIGKKGPSMTGGNISHCDGMRDLTQTL